MDIDITRMSSKGQITIPAEMRKNMQKGEKLVVIKNDDQLIVEKVSRLGKNFAEDLEFAKRTEKAWKKYEKGKFKSKPVDKFLEELSEW